MRLRAVVVGLTLLNAHLAQAASGGRSSAVAPEPVVGAVSIASPVDGDVSWLAVGDVAPEFSYIGADGQWERFGALLNHGPVVLVFGMREGDMKSLESARTVFMDLGVTPAVAMDMRPGSAVRLARRVGLSATVVADPRCAIATVFNCLDPANLHHAPAYFVVDEHHRIRAIGHGALPTPLQLAALSARSLGKPVPESAYSMSVRY